MKKFVLYRYGHRVKFIERFAKTKRFIPTLIISLGLVGVITASTVFGAPPPQSSVDIEQCANGPSAGPLNICKKLSGNDGYVTGNVNATKAHWQEGDFLPYRAIVVAPNSGTQQVAFSFDTAKSSELKHAIDYLSDYNLTETTGAATTTHANQANPCGDKISGCNPSSPDSSFAIPVPTSLTSAYPLSCASGSFSPSATGGSVKAWVSTGIVAITNITIGAPDSSSTDCPSKFTIDFTLSVGSATVVFAWSGHVAANLDPGSGGFWGAGHSVPSGSPYHMHAGFTQVSGGQSFNVGNQDLSLASSAIIAPDSPTVSTTIHSGSNHTTDVQNTTLALGSTIHDKASLNNSAGNNGTPAGTVTFKYFTNGSCNGDPVDTSSALALSSGAVDATGFAKGPLGAGSYSFLAHYTSSDVTKWKDADGSCEHVSVGQASTTTATQVHDAAHQDVTNTALALGSTVHDSATVGTQVGSITIGGNVTYHFYTSGDCTGTPTDETVAVGTESSTTSALGAGSYSYKAEYLGDTNYTSSLGSCEPFSVNKAQLTVTTAVHDASHADQTNASVPLGSVMHDTATVSGGVNGFALPAVSFSLTTNYTDSCSDGTAVANTGTEAGATKSADSDALAAATYAYHAVVAGNDNYLSDDSDCEVFTVNKAQLGIGTTVHSDSPDQVLAGNLALGAGAHDSASVTGQVSGFTAPNVTFYFFANGVSCTNGDTTGATALNSLSPDGSGIAHPSTSQTGLAAGTYNFMAVVAGNGNYDGATSDCEPFTVDKSQLAMESKVHDADHVDQTNNAVPLGSVMHDTAKLTGGVVEGFTPAAITFKFYTNDSCTEGDDVNNLGADEGDASRDRSAASSALPTGSYSYKAFVADSDNYLGTDSGCEPFSISKADLGITTIIHDANHGSVTAVPLGSVVHDTADVSGQVNPITPTGAVSFTFFTSNDCTTGGSSVTTTSDGTDPVRSADSSALAAGSYSYQASVAGDDNYNGATATCEPLTVNKAQLTASTIVHDASHTDKTNGSVPLGSVMHDTATVSGGVDGFALPAVSFTLTSSYTDSCATGDAVANNGTEAGATKSADSAALGAGNYAYRATVGTNSNYIGADSSCEPFTVNQAQLTVSTNIHNANHQIVTAVQTGSIVHDTASVSGAVNGFSTPAVSFTFYTNNSCSGTGAPVTNLSSDEANAALRRSANSAPLAGGSYSYKASIAGNANYIGNNSDCEPLTVQALWCSPGFWATAISKNRLGVLAYLSTHFVNLNTKYSVAKAAVNGAALSKKAPAGDPTIAQVLGSPSTYGGPAFNTVANYIAFVLGWGGTQNTGENCPLDAHGNFTTSTFLF